MPELPEVEAARRQLMRWANGRRLQWITAHDSAVLRTKMSTMTAHAVGDAQGQLDELVGRIAAEPRRLGKRLAWGFGDLALLLHLGMTGRLMSGDLPRHARLSLGFEGDRIVHFDDPRRFGCVVVGTTDAINLQLEAGLGPDALLDLPDAVGLAARFKTTTAIKVALLDQKRIAGIGNIQAAEALYRAKIGVKQRAHMLTASQWTRLRSAIAVQLRHTLSEIDLDGVVYMTDRGASNPFVVYGRAGAACPECGSAIVQEKLGGRATFWCSGCQ